MIFTASLSNLTKKVYGERCKSCGSIQTIIDTLPVDPQVSKMHVLLLGPKDMTGITAVALKEAVKHAHPAICIIYLATNKREKDMFLEAPHSKVVHKLTGSVIQETVTEFYQTDIDSAKPDQFAFDSKPLDLGKNPIPVRVEAEPPSSPSPEPTEEETPIPEPVSIPDEPTAIELPVEPIPDPEPAPPAPPLPDSAEDMVASVKSVKDWNILKEQMRRDSVISQLVLRDSEYAGLQKMLELYDMKIRDIWSDRSISSAEKMELVREIGTERTALQGTANGIFVKRFLAICSNVINTCVANVDTRVEEMTKAVSHIQSEKGKYIEQTIARGTPLWDELYNYMIELVNIEANLCTMFDYMHTAGVDDIANRLNEKLPSKDEFINHAVDVSRELYRPDNTNLYNSILEALSKGQISLSMVDDKVTALSHTIYNIIAKQSDYIAYQNLVIDLLRANNVEQVVVRDTLLKNCFHVMVGGVDIGTTATTAAYAGMLSRNHNTLVIDISGHTHYDMYGHTTVEIDRFLQERVQQPLLFVAGERVDDPERIFEIMEKAKELLTYYHHIIMVLDPEQTIALDQVGREALSISYITNCTAKSLKETASAYATGRNIPNVATKLLTIDCPIDASDIVLKLDMDIATTKLIPLPYFQEMKQAALRNQPPHTYGDILRVFEEAYRV